MSSTLDRYTPPPSVSEYDALNKMAAGLAKTTVVPQNYRGKPGDIVAAALYGREIGLSPLAALQRIVVINGKPTLDAQGMLAVVRAAGHSVSGDTSATVAKAVGKRGDNGDTMSIEWTIAMAKSAGLVKKGPWTDYPQAMLWARAVTQLCRMLFPDVLAGFSYAPEEIGGDAPVEHADTLPTRPITVEVVKEDEEVVTERPLMDSGYMEVRDVDTDTGEVIDANKPKIVRGPEPTGDWPERLDDYEWDDAASQMAENNSVQTDDAEIVSEIRKRKNLMRPVHARLGDLTDDDGKDRLLRGYFRAGSWKQIPSDRLKGLLNADDEQIKTILEGVAA